MISHDRGGEWKTIHLTDEHCKDVSLKASSSFNRDEFISEQATVTKLLHVGGIGGQLKL